MGRPTPGVMLLMVLHAVVWLAVQPLPGLFDVLAMSPDAVLSGEVWRLVTFPFAVRDLGTLLLTVLLSLLFLAPAVEQRLGKAGFLGLYLGSAAAAALGLTLVHVVTGTPEALAGPVASNLAVLAAFVFMMPDARLLAYFVVPVRAVYLLYFFLLLRVAEMWQAQQFLWRIACEFLGVAVAYGMTGRRGWRSWDVHLVERFRNWRYRRKMRNFTVHSGGRKTDPSQYLH